MVELVKQLPGTLTPCPRCHNQPKLVVVGRGPTAYMECYPCRFRLPAMNTEQEAIQSWEMAVQAISPLFPTAQEATDVIGNG